MYFVLYTLTFFNIFKLTELFNLFRAGVMRKFTKTFFMQYYFYDQFQLLT